MRSIVASLSLMTCMLLMLGCQRGVTWKNTVDGTDANGIAATSERIILSVPAQTTLLDAKHPQASRDFGQQLANHLKGFVANTQFFYAPDLPAAGSDAWAQGTVAGAQGANLVILCAVTDIAIKKIAGRSNHNRMVQSTVQLRVLNSAGKELWRKSHSARKLKTDSPKFSSGVNSPASRATWEANRQCIAALKKWFDVQSDSEMFDGTQPLLGSSASSSSSAASATPTARADVNEITLQLDSSPSGADVLVDNKLRGTTPCTLTLNPAEIELRIELAGHQAWQRRFTLDENMALTPTLQVDSVSK